MAYSANTNTVPKLYRSVIEDVINDVRDIFLDDGVDEQVLMELKTLWEKNLLQSRAVDGFHSEEQQLLLQVQQQQQQHHHHHHHHQQAQLQQTVPQQAQTQQVLIPASQQATAPQVIVPDSKLLQHMNASSIPSAAATAATLALPAGVTPVQLLTNSSQLLQVVRAANGAQYILQPQQSVVLQQVIPQMQPGGVQVPVIQQVLAPFPGGMSPQTGVIIQPQQILFPGNKTQVIPTTVAAPAPAQAQIPAAGQQQPQAQPAQQQAPLVLQVDGTGDTSSEEDDEEDYDEEEEEDKEKDGAEDGQVEEEPLNSDDDLSDEEGQEPFDTENVVVCQYDKIHRSKNKWKFHLKDGIMNLNGRDYIFSKAIGDAEW
uniref:Transcription initiation factor IIA subunit 1 n=1 Tax=Mus spicilegus TaxID=10103 RepID=A0A8C6MND5_MUSSI